MGPFYTVRFFRGINDFHAVCSGGLLLFGMLFCVQMLDAQTFSVSGLVISSEDNQPLIGVSVQEKGAGNGAKSLIQ